MAATLGQFRLFSTGAAVWAVLQPVQPAAARLPPPAAFPVLTTGLEHLILGSELRMRKNADPVSRFSLDRISTERVRLR
jgi:hypothetical protein